MRFRKAQARRRIFGWLNADLAFKLYVLVALLSTSGLDMLLFVTILLLTVVAAVELGRATLVAVPMMRSAGSRHGAPLEADSA